MSGVSYEIENMRKMKKLMAAFGGSRSNGNNSMGCVCISDGTAAVVERCLI